MQVKCLTWAAAAATALFLLACSKKADEKEILPKAITLNETELFLTVGETSTLVANVSPSGASDKTVSWSSTNPAKVTVDAGGVVTAVSQGSAYVVAETVNAIKTSCLVNVAASARYKVSITVDGAPAPAMIYGWPGRQIQLAAASSDGEEHSYQWSASAGAASVSESGLVSFALGSPAGAEGYAWWGESDIKVVTPDGRGASLSAISSVSDRFQWGASRAALGGTVPLATGAGATVSLFSFDGTEEIAIPQEAYSLRSGDSSKLVIEGSSVKALENEGSVPLYVVFQGGEETLCTVNIQKQTSSSNSTVESYTEETPDW